MTVEKIPLRHEIAPTDTWELERMFPTAQDWETSFTTWEQQANGYERFRGTLGQGPATILELLKFDEECERLGDRLGTYAFLREAEDITNTDSQGRKGRFYGVAARFAEAASFITPELLSLPDETLQSYLSSAELSTYKLWLTRLTRYKPHTLTEAEERLLAMLVEVMQTPSNTFDQLTDADMQFGEIEMEPGYTIELTQGSLMVCLESPNRAVREQAFRQFYKEFESHANTLAATYSGSVRQDVYNARVRNYPSARAAAMFPDNVSETVYDNLILAVRQNLPAVHRYYELRRKAMQLPDIHFYDVYVPILSDIEKHHTWDQAVDAVIASLHPLGQEYCTVLEQGLRGRWCDRYENKGKHSGAFSSGCFDSDPYILMNFKESILDHVYTLTHEAGHSMHSWYSRKNQPFQYANYTIFVAEVASTFNEQLLGKHLYQHASDDRERAYYINRELDDIRKTIIRQTMFAEFEHRIHAMAEANDALTLASIRATYQELLEAYFGPNFMLDPELSLEGLRIPHFYRAFYVYKYSTGLAAAIALADRVINGGQQELNDYLNFLKSGASKDPLELLRDAGVDMSTPEPVNKALQRFSTLTDELERLLNL
ncbi:MAG: oligoendopeptidase F [Zavarzinella sp.]